MTPEQAVLLKQWAREAGFNLQRDEWLFNDMLTSFAALVAAHQREMDARICESEDMLWVDGKPTADAFAAAIRGQPTSGPAR